MFIIVGVGDDDGDDDDDNDVLLVDLVVGVQVVELSPAGESLFLCLLF